MLTEVSFADAKIILNKLWPLGYEFFDNIHAQVLFNGREAVTHLKPRYFAWREQNQIVGTTHCYRTGYGRVRVRGTFFDESCRGKGFAQMLVLGALANFSDCHEAYTFPRTGTERFYQNIGFLPKAPPGPSSESRHGFSYAEKALRTRLHM